MGVGWGWETGDLPRTALRTVPVSSRDEHVAVRDPLDGRNVCGWWPVTIGFA